MKTYECEKIQALRKALSIAKSVNEKLEYCYQQHLKASGEAQQAA